MSGLHKSGLDPKLSAYRFYTNASNSIGKAGIPTIGFGPGKEADAHVVDERISLDGLEKVAFGYMGIIHTVFGQKKSEANSGIIPARDWSC